jgi:hypothetical protein
MNCSLLIFNSSCAESVAFKSRFVISSVHTDYNVEVAMNSVLTKLLFVFCSLAENVDTPSPLALTQIGCESRIEPIDEFLHNTRRITLQCLRDAGSVSIFK